jgi:thymidine phosphorylase
MLLGAGRETVTSTIDPAVGVVLHKKVGDAVEKGEPLLTVHVNDRRRLEESLEALRRAIEVTPERPEPPPLVRAILDAP